ncbi:hypothetical protein [Anaerotruncus sp. DFI.9.16]|uniref:hypothetical protein n=1 Tax=Anaerotruncus sp. DFI.9.16 TaxID=2965275 RepID=UPI00210E0B29|nr:hypothetical protein [Anaerotruncus sp. DFI.9.16]MCQ4897382.1 hypothetical protein [Anaerotruncus sp. DFI.9.16]
MKKRLGTLILVTLMITSLLPACGISTRGTLPYGVWQNKTLGLTLNITEPIAIKITQPPIEAIDPTKPIEYERKVYTGFYVIDGMETDILILFSNHAKEFYIYNAAEYPAVYDKAYFFGSYRFDDKQLRYKVIGWWEEQTGIPEIIFTKIEDYEGGE